MSGGVIIDAFGDRKKTEVMEETWGHLAPEFNVKYVGQVIFCQSETGDLVPISSHFTHPDTGKELPGSPWFQMDLNEFVNINAKEAGQIYRFAGQYWRNKNGRAHFSGRIDKCFAAPDLTPRRYTNDGR